MGKKMEHEMETREHIGGYIGIIEKKMEATIQGLGLGS